MPVHATLSATPAVPRSLSDSAISGSSGTYPASDTYPGATTYPGRGSDISASGISNTTDYIPATVPFTVQSGTRVIQAVPIT